MTTEPQVDILGPVTVKFGRRFDLAVALRAYSEVMAHVADGYTVDEITVTFAKRVVPKRLHRPRE